MKKNVVIVTNNKPKKPRFYVENKRDDLLLTADEIKRLSAYAFFEFHTRDDKNPHGFDRIKERYKGKEDLAGMISNCRYAFMTLYHGKWYIQVCIDLVSYLIISMDNGNVVTFVVKDNGMTNDKLYRLELKHYKERKNNR